MAVDWFAVLGVPKDADVQAINTAWRRLVLLHHPDKLRDADNVSNTGDIHLINEARAILSDPARRAAYVEAQANPMHEQPNAPSGQPTIHQFFSLADFTPHFEPDNVIVRYTHPCRCSGMFTITYEQLEDGVEVVGCPGCGQWCRVGYEVDEEEGEGGVTGDGGVAGANGTNPAFAEDKRADSPS